MNALRLTVVCLLVGLVPLAHAAPGGAVQSMEFSVDGAVRTALVYVPTALPANGLVPLVFAFHGHGGSSRNAMSSFDIQRSWPEAIAVYPQGFDTPGKLTDPEGKLPGWQKTVGDQGDRDLHFFDAMLARLKKDYPVDAKRIYCTGHSNGGGFTYLLWLTRPEVFAAVAPSASAAAYAAQLTPKPAMILAGRSDTLVKFEWQEMMMAAVRRINGCDATGVPWEGGAGTIYPSKGGTPLVTFIHPGGHPMDPVEPGLIVKFFQSQTAVPKS